MSNPPTQTSTTLLNRVAGGGDEEAARTFVQHYAPMVRAIARAGGLGDADAEDVVQEVMMAAIEALRQHRYDRERAGFKAWLKGVIFHKIQKARAARGRAAGSGLVADDDTGTAGETARPSIRRSHASDIPDPRPSPYYQLEAEFEAQWQQVAYEEAIDEIRREVDPTTFQAFDLYARKNRPVREVAQLLGLSRNAVYIAKTRVMDRLRQKLSE